MEAGAAGPSLDRPGVLDWRRTRRRAPPEAPRRRRPARRTGREMTLVERRIDKVRARRGGARPGPGTARVCRGPVERGAPRRRAAEFLRAGVVVGMVVSMRVCRRGEGRERIDNLRAAQVARAPMEGRTAGQRRGHVALGHDGADEAIAQQGRQGREAPSRRGQAEQTPPRSIAAAFGSDTPGFSHRPSVTG